MVIDYHNRELARLHQAALLREADTERLARTARARDEDLEGRRARGLPTLARLLRALRRGRGKSAVARPA